MQLIFSSKNLELTDGFKTFVERKLSSLQKFTSLGLSKICINVNVDRNRKGVASDAEVELVGDINQKRIAVRESGETFYKAFFGATTKMKELLSKEKEKREEK
ncbi:ribosome-associated translation inhibitor RaiA [Candidatus Cerribacteria bacterium 'Amazon FNV 2010 28 9']|uniref:Ribosome-associated translation inhibitor RaiA n=1 Tax=Candidatus Cerribacteria bacterium 'Amazon FNV 2010 28 9' TaxID=2081795 RepID=A0A317JV99_9BACT|nr:MAG: ribosome-associated translation inhibitor RaiA [Candidatus Cerribacteria bacterium 'Amazon FNV 2010 28 9']